MTEGEVFDNPSRFALHSLVSVKAEGRCSVCDKEFRDVSIITSRHINKDAINNLGVQRFASERNLQLHSFYAEDTIRDPDQHRSNRRRMAKVPLDEQCQCALWEQPTSSVEKRIAGKLTLRKGLPVQLRSNSATELCMTNGQEGTVYAWQSSKGLYGQPVLEVLFVELANPPQPVKFEDLPLNVVPIMRSSVNTTVSLPTGENLYVSRSQVEIAVNYSMTDFASQGKTRHFNVVNLNDGDCHQGYYTALSRSSTAAGTLILQGFDTSLITKKCSGDLRGEFRDLEILDDITRLRYVGKLHS